MNYKVEGSGKEWVTLVTGIANDLTMWDGQVAALERDFRILRYDLRGHGSSEATAGDYSIALLVRDLLDVWESAVPGARHSSVPNAAHIANIQNPGGFNLVLTEFLKRK